MFTTEKEAPEYTDIPLLTDDISIENLTVLRGKILEKLDDVRLEDESVSYTHLTLPTICSV